MKTIGVCLAGDVDFDLSGLTHQYAIEEWIAVDGGYDHLIKQKQRIKIAIGDFDSTNYEIDQKIVYPTEKDETDFKLAINFINEQYNDIKIIVCGVHANERLEHFISNLMLMETNMTYITKHNIINLLKPGKHVIQSQLGGFSLFSKNEVENLTIENAKYTLNNYNLSTTDNLTISNDFIDNKSAKISFTSGELYIYLKR